MIFVENWVFLQNQVFFFLKNLVLFFKNWDFFPKKLGLLSDQVILGVLSFSFFLYDQVFCLLGFLSFRYFFFWVFFLLGLLSLVLLSFRPLFLLTINHSLVSINPLISTDLQMKMKITYKLEICCKILNSLSKKKRIFH